ncbi:MAG: hypothetical protein WD045_09715 [Pirellulaceae bacterium]
MIAGKTATGSQCQWEVGGQGPTSLKKYPDKNPPIRHIEGAQRFAMSAGKIFFNSQKLKPATSAGKSNPSSIS